MGQGDPGGEHQAGVTSEPDRIFHNVPFGECVPMTLRGQNAKYVRCSREQTLVAYADWGLSLLSIRERPSDVAGSANASTELFRAEFLAAEVCG